jgi:glucokinase
MLRADAARRGITIDGIGVGVPGIVDPDSGDIGPEIHHVPELADRPLGALLAARFGVPVFVDNDVNALALAEWTFGAARGARSLVVLAAGTGFGAGIVLDGRLVRGARGFGGEFGHTPVKFDGRPCWCGGRGCLAVYASGRGIAEAAGEPLGAARVFRRAAEGDPVAAAVVDEACRALGAMIATIVNGLNPETVLVTGGVAVSFAPLEARILAAAAAHALERALGATTIRIVPGDKRVTMRGPAALVRYELGRRPTPSGRPAEARRRGRGAAG